MSLVTRVSNNLGLKVFAVALALLMSWWVYEVKNPEISKKLDLTLKVTNLDSSLVITEPDPLPLKFWAQVHGPLRSVNYISSSTHVARLDCKELTEPGLSAVRIDIPDLDDVIVDDQEFRFLDVRVEQKATLEKRITLDTKGLATSEYEISRAELSQDNVTITGPAPLVQQVAEARVEANLSGVTQSANLVLTVNLVDENGQTITGPALETDPNRVRYTVTLVPKGAIKVLKVIPDYSGQPPEDFIVDSMTPKPLLIPVSKSLVEPNDNFVRTAPIDLNGQRESFTAVVELIYPFEVPEISTLPITCEVAVQIIPVEEYSSVRLALILTGQNPAYDYVVAPQDLLVKSEQPEQMDLKLLGQVQAILDVSMLEPGEHRLVPQLALPLGLDRVKIDPRSVLVTVLIAEPDK